jgi:hypothetical protein
MKKLLTITTALAFPAFLFSQEKSRLKEFLYVKVSPTLLVVAKATERLSREGSLTPAVFAAIGAKMRYAAVGFSAGYFNLKGAGIITPWGVDLTITDFKRKKTVPVITAQWHQAHFKEQYTLGGYGSYSTYITGKDMYSIGGGAAFRTLKTAKLLVTVGFSRLKANTRIDSRYGPNSGPTKYYKDHYDMLVLAASLVL